MKKIIFATSIFLLTAVALRAIWVYNAYLFNGVVAYNQNAVLNLNTTPNASGIARLTAQAVYSSSTLPTDTFNDGRVSTATFTVVTNTGISSATATDQITIAANSVIQSSAAADSVTVVSTNGLTGASITLNGTVLTNNGWRVDLTSDTAADIATQINAYVYQVIATPNSSKVLLAARNKGVGGNSYTLVTSTPTALSASSATFTGGQNDAFQNQSITINGSVYPRGNYWNFPNTGPLTSTGTAASIASLINSISGMQASAAGSVVFATATVYGTAANAYTIVSSTPTAMTVANPTFTGGVNNAVITINGTALTQGAQWSAGANTTATAASIAAAINASASLSSIVVATNTANIVNTTSTAVGTLSNYTTTSSTPAAIAALHATYVGGQNSSFAINSPTIFIASHGYVTGIPVLLSTGGAAAPSPLANQTTYYVIAVDANDIQLATTSARAQSGLYVTITSSSTTGPHTYTLTPSTITGTAGLQWQVSNDCVNYTNYTTTLLGVAVSSLTFATPYTASATTWDLGPVNYECIRAALTGPSTGGWALQLKLNGSNP
jgi:hypothetical protein